MPTIANETWTINRTNAKLNQKTLQIPHFQRAQVWKDNQKRLLIESIRNQYPIGALLIYRSSDGDLVVDGLQRISTVKSFYEEQLRYYHPIDSELIQIVCAGVHKILPDKECSGEQAHDILRKWLDETKVPKTEQGFSANKLAEYVVNEYEVGDQEIITHRLSNEIQGVIDRINTEVNAIEKYEIPVIVYEGDRSVLPDIFERLNSKGTKLSKYEIFAATWHNVYVEITNEHICNAVIDKYQVIENQGFIVEGFNNGKVENYTLFEYLFGLGKVLATRYPELFSSDDDSSKIENFGFVLMTIGHGLRLSEMADLPEYIEHGSAGSSLLPEAFEEALFKSCDFVYTQLKPYFDVQLGGSKAPLIAHSDYQISSIILSVLLNMFIPGTWEKKNEWNSQKVAFQKGIPQHYLFDIISGQWAGSGDSRMYNVVWSDEVPGTPIAYYENPISRDDWNNVLDVWFGAQLKCEQKSRPNISKLDKLWLKYVSNNIISVGQQAQFTFDVDHVFPVALLAGVINDTDSDGWPISCVGNLMLLDSTTNKAKNKMEYSKYCDSLDEYDPKDRETLDRIKSGLLVPLAMTVVDIETPMTRERYLDFIMRRFEEMKKLVLDKLSVGYK